MKKYRISINYGKNDDSRYRMYDGDVTITPYMTFAEMTYEMRKVLMEYVNQDMLTKEQAFDMVGDIPAFNMFMEELCGLD